MGAALPACRFASSGLGPEQQDQLSGLGQALPQQSVRAGCSCDVAQGFAGNSPEWGVSAGLKQLW